MLHQLGHAPSKLVPSPKGFQGPTLHPEVLRALLPHLAEAADGVLRPPRHNSVVAKYFWAFILPVLEYCSPVWMSAATSHLLLVNGVVGRVSQLSGGGVSCDLWFRCRVASMCVFFKIDSLVDHFVRSLVPTQYVIRRPTRGALAAHSRSFEMLRFRTGQFSLSFVLSCFRLWDGLHKSAFAGEGLVCFKTSVSFFLLQDLSTISLHLFFSLNLR